MAENWKPSNWDALASGASCPLCDIIRDKRQEDEFQIAVADLGFSRLFLVRNQFVRGYCVLFSVKHVLEPYQLNAAEQRMFFDDMAIAGRGLQNAFRADKMNYNILGNSVPHLHAHILPRYFTDSAPQRPIDPWLEGYEVFLSAEEYAERIRLIREHLEAR